MLALPRLSAGRAIACELLLIEPREGRELARLPGAGAELVVAFEHSVLGTTVHDHYEWRRGGWLLVQERFEGQGYGLPHAAAAGERLEPLGAGRWALHTARAVSPLVLRPVAGMRLLLSGREPLMLKALGASSIELRMQACDG